MREKTLVYEQRRRHVYALIGPRFPAMGYRGEVIFTANAAGGTDLRWSGSFTEGLPRTGPVMLTLLRGAVKFLFGQAGESRRARTPYRSNRLRNWKRPLRLSADVSA